MKKIGITGSLASGKTSASKIISQGNGPLFSADEVVKNLYKKESFKKIVSKKFEIKNSSNLKKNLKNKILLNTSLVKKLENLIHPLVRREMRGFIKKNKNKKLVFLEVPLLIESKLMNYFDTIIFIKAKKSIRLKRFLLKGGDRKIFKILTNNQLADNKKIKFCDHVVVNDSNLKFLKKNLLDILRQYV